MTQLLSLPFTYLLTAAAAAAALLAGWLYATLARESRNLPETEPARLSSAVVDTGFTAVLVFVVVWKLSPLLFSLRTVLAAPIALLYLPGGPAGTLAGLIAAAVYVAVRHRATLRDSSRYTLQLKRSLGIMLAVGLLIWIPGQRLASLLEQRPGQTSGIRIGAEAPDFSLATLEAVLHNSDERVSLADLQGSPTVVNFWATWCPPCRAEFPELVTLQQEFGSEIQVVGINLTHTEQSAQQVAGFTSRYDPGFLQLMDTDGMLQARYGVRVVPTTFILDSDGRVVHRRVGAVSAAVLRGQLRSLLE
ncbi:TlpA family protein disulfide reductase [Spirochaeta africana]|uniref:Thiol-disulfide isomerase-like thioredoxin n=1 Tax=Spirochaeta africana (strain ATCC 700263 / DSM 8902 / Z-7692) TaxID=889378 RepID=H9UGH0_SPIAZ|nr:TlpA disulfide reductase family protein [Spirochaeta africana]AFG36613.1 thiol-disulfide isomerase-like thioredoxin [Spirochaeta africana DSM 8902]